MQHHPSRDWLVTPWWNKLGRHVSSDSAGGRIYQDWEEKTESHLRRLEGIPQAGGAKSETNINQEVVWAHGDQKVGAPHWHIWAGGAGVSALRSLNLERWWRLRYPKSPDGPRCAQAQHNPPSTGTTIMMMRCSVNSRINPNVSRKEPPITPAHRHPCCPPALSWCQGRSISCSLCQLQLVATRQEEEQMQKQPLCHFEQATIGFLIKWMNATVNLN